jgi:hypothetical protein
MKWERARTAQSSNSSYSSDWIFQVDRGIVVFHHLSTSWFALFTKIKHSCYRSWKQHELQLVLRWWKTTMPRSTWKIQSLLYDEFELCAVLARSHFITAPRNKQTAFFVRSFAFVSIVTNSEFRRMEHSLPVLCGCLVDYQKLDQIRLDQNKHLFQVLGNGHTIPAFNSQFQFDARNWNHSDFSWSIR